MAVMILATKGASESVKFLMNDISNMVQTVQETCFDIKKSISVLESYMDINECSSTIFFECTKRVTKLWLATANTSVRFTIRDLHSVYDLSTVTNYHKNSGHILLFSEDFDTDESLRTVKAVFEGIFSPRENASVERALCLYHVDGKIYMRNYIIDGMDEVGPRLEMVLDKILAGCFRGTTVFNRNIEEASDRPSD